MDFCDWYCRLNHIGHSLQYIKYKSRHINTELRSLILHITVSSHLYAQFSTARIPLFASNVILKSCFTQCESWITITLTPSYSLISLETLCAYMREDTVTISLFNLCHAALLKVQKSTEVWQTLLKWHVHASVDISTIIDGRAMVLLSNT